MDTKKPNINNVAWSEVGAALGAIRRQVFVEEQGVPEELEWDGLDAGASHFLAQVDGVAVGCARLLSDGHIGRMAVLQPWRGRGIGTALLRAVLDACRRRGQAQVFLNAQIAALDFYRRLGFHAVGGEFMDAGIPHLRMERAMENLAQHLNHAHGIAGKLCFVDAAPGLPVAEVTLPQAGARIAVNGAQVLEWAPAGQRPVIWVSRAAVYQPGKGVRGGVPVCWPWFGAGEGGKPAHGFVRARLWQVRQTGLGPADTVFLRLGLSDDESTRALWNHAFDLELVVSVGAALKMELVTRNTGAEPFTLTDGLHTYFRVGDIGKTRVLGLEDTAYLDKVQGMKECRQRGAVTFDGETDRVYLDTEADCIIDDGALGRKIRIAKSGSRSSVVWNPWSEKEKGFADMAEGEYRDMLCVETTNAAADSVVVPPGGEHRLVAFVGVE